jgi:hypothetical protein
MGLYRRWTRLQAKAMRLADNGIAAHATKFFCNLGCGHPFGPHRSQLFDAFVGPGHLFTTSTK